jgi:hypothetical protein
VEFLRDVAAELQKYELLGPGIVGRVCSKMQRQQSVRYILRIRLLIQIMEFSIAQLVWCSVRLGMGAAPGPCPS